MTFTRAAFAATVSFACAAPLLAATPVAKTVTATAKPLLTGTRTVTDRVPRIEVSNPSPLSGTIGIDKFDPARGILTGASVSINAPMKVTLSGESTSSSTSEIGASYVGQLSGAGFTTLASSSAAVSRNCNSNSCVGGSASRTVSGSRTIAANALAGYHGSGQTDLTLTMAGRVVADLNRLSSSGAVTANAALEFGSSDGQVANALTMTYSYLDFATPSFSSADPTVKALTLDFGRIVQGGAAKTLTFSLTNIGGASTAGLSLKSIATAGSGFTTTLVPFTNGLAGGQSGTYSMTLNPSTAGAYDQSLALTFEDFAPDGVGLGSYQLTLRAIGQIFVPRVPEPATWAMMICGFALVGGALRGARRRMPQVAC